MNKITNPKQPVDVSGYEGRLPELMQNIVRMRYDKVRDAYAHSAVELRRQAQGDREKGRAQLAGLLEEAATLSDEQRELFDEIWALCEPHMRDEM